MEISDKEAPRAIWRDLTGKHSEAVQNFAWRCCINEHILDTLGTIVNFPDFLIV